MKTNNAVAAARKTKSFTAARLDWWEAGYFTDGSKERMRREAKRTLHRAVRRSKAAHIADQEG